MNQELQEGIIMSAVLVERQIDMPSPPMALTPAQMVAVAVHQGADMDKLERLMALQRNWEAEEARKAFVAAMAGFKADPGKIVKTKQVNIPGGAKFAHATLADVCDGVVANLSKNGLSHRWDIEQREGLIRVTCILAHEGGHCERVVMSAPPDDSGKKNGIQQIASTVTYLERYTLMAACGLSAKDMDDDGASAGQHHQKKEVSAPEGYANWRADMTALADEGTARLQSAWQAASPEYRRHVVSCDGDWWATTKNKASRAQVPA